MQILRGLSSPDSQPIALTIGNFDGVHLGHQALLAKVKQVAGEAGMQSAALVFEPHPREFFTPEQAPARLTSLREKQEQFEALGLDRVYVCHFDQALAQTPAEDFIHALHGLMHARYVLVGDDFRFGSGRGGDFPMLQQAASQAGFAVESMHSVLLDGVRISSTAIRAALAGGDLATARQYLGRHYSISGRVERGNRVGHQLGYPTANIQLKHNAPPLTGIFVVRVRVEGGGWIDGVASLGVRPTIEQQGKPVLEVHLFDFAGDLYEKHMHVDFLHKLRDEAKFSGLESLQRQIAKDVEQARNYFTKHSVSCI